MGVAKREVRVGIGLLGPNGSGKSALLEGLRDAHPAAQQGPLTQLHGRDGTIIIHDHLELQLGHVGDLPLFVDVWALPGDPAAELARRIVLSTCNGYLFASNRSSLYFGRCQKAFQELRECLRGRQRTVEDASLVALVTETAKQSSHSGTDTVETFLKRQVGDDRVMGLSTTSAEQALEAVRKLTAQILAKERDDLEARRKGKPPPRIAPPLDLIADIDLAHQLYLRMVAIAGKDFSPHSERALGQVFLELEGCSSEDLEEALVLISQAQGLDLSVSLAEVMLQREMIDPDVVTRGERVRRCIEVIHEEVVWGRVAAELGAVDVERIKRALVVQNKRHFQYSLEQLLMRAGQLDRRGRERIQVRQAEVHQEELAREASAEAAGPQQPWDTGGARAQVPLFGQVAVNLGLVTEEQLQECIDDQARLRRQGTQRFLGALMRVKGYLGEDEIPLVCRALEAEITADRLEGYEIFKSLGRGNMALVYSARQINLDRVVALKVLDPKLLFDADFITRFVEEARAAARLNHPNIVQAYDVGSHDDLHYFAMEYVDGVTLRDLIDEPGFLDEQTAVDIIVQVARALGHAAKHKLVHRDVKPQNIMVTRDGVAKLCDLGLAKRIDQGGDREGMILGSPYYISPEQIEGRGDIDTRADIYSLGATLFHMVTGRPPYKGRTPEDVCLKHLSEPVPDPATLSGSVTQRITPVLFKMMAKDRRYRYADCAEVVRDLLMLRPTAASDERLGDIAFRLSQTFPAPTARWNN